MTERCRVVTALHEKTAQYIRRGYPLSCFEQAVNELHRRGIPVIVHTILGLPGEGQEEVFATMDYLNGLSISGIKLQLLHVLKNTDLAADYAAGKFEVLEQEAYPCHRLSAAPPSRSCDPPCDGRRPRGSSDCTNMEPGKTRRLK